MKTTQRTLLASLLIALTIAAGYALAAVPNVELVTLLAFLSGFLLGPAYGALVGGAAMAGHSMFNVMGAAVPPILVAQSACYALIGVAGALVGPYLRRMAPAPAAIAAAVCAALLVTLYQVVVNVVSFYTFASETVLWVYLWGGLAFSSIHIAWNTALFAVVLRPTLAVLDRHRLDLREAT